jgi:hypothetical protein
MNYPIEVIERIKFSKCPTCGDKVFIPKDGWQKDYGGTSENPIVFCIDHGHWIGFLKDCELKGKMSFITKGIKNEL